MLEPRGPIGSEPLSFGEPAAASVPTPRAPRRATYPQLAEEYLDRILVGDCTGAVRLVVDAVEQGGDADRLVTEVVERAVADLDGRIARGSITPAQRRSGDKVTGWAMSMLRPPVFELPDAE